MFLLTEFQILSMKSATSRSCTADPIKESSYILICQTCVIFLDYERKFSSPIVNYDSIREIRLSPLQFILIRPWTMSSYHKHVVPFDSFVRDHICLRIVALDSLFAGRYRVTLTSFCISLRYFCKASMLRLWNSRASSIYWILWVLVWVISIVKGFLDGIPAYTVIVAWPLSVLEGELLMINWKKDTY